MWNRNRLWKFLQQQKPAAEVGGEALAVGEVHGVVTLPMHDLAEVSRVR